MKEEQIKEVMRLAELWATYAWKACSHGADETEKSKAGRAALEAYLRTIEPAQSVNAELLDALKDISKRLSDHPAYQELTDDEENDIGGDTAEFSYLVRIANSAIARAETINRQAIETAMDDLVAIGQEIDFSGGESINEISNLPDVSPINEGNSPCSGRAEGDRHRPDMIDLKQLAENLRRYNAWRRGAEGVEMPSPKDLGVWIDSAIAVLEAHAENNDLARRVERLAAERDALAAELKALEPKCPSYMPDWPNHGAAIADPVFHQIRGIMGTQNWGQEDALRKAVLHALRAIQRSVEASNQPTEAGYEND